MDPDTSRKSNGRNTSRIRLRAFVWGCGRIPAVLAVLGMGLVHSPVATAQSGVLEPPPLVRSVTFEGNDNLSSSDLQARLATRPTRCRGFVLRPICLFSDGDVITERHRLDLDELPRDELRLRVIYFRKGFRQAAVASEIRDRDDGVDVVFHVVEGPPTLVEAMRVEQPRVALSDRDIGLLGLPEEGRPFDLDALDAALELLGEELENRGYFDARLTDSIEIRSDGGRASVHLEIHSGSLATVERFDVEGSDEIEEETIILALHLEEGGVITAPLLRRSRNALHQSNLFHEANVTIADHPDSATDSAKVVMVRVREAPPRLSRVGAGFSTLEFGQLEGRFSHYNWFGRGRRLDLRAGLGNLLAPQLTGRGPFHDILPGDLSGVDESPFRRPTWQLSAELQQPAFRAAENLLSIGVFSHRRVIPGVSVDQGTGAELTLVRRLAFRTTLSLSHRFEVTSVEAGEVFFCVHHGICESSAIESLRRSNALAPLGLSFQMDRSDDALGPTSGYRLRLDAEHASGPTLSDYHYHRVSGSASWYRPFVGLPPHVLAARVRAGWVRPLESTRDVLGISGDEAVFLHPRKRFFAGGARSVRGYSENQLGPRILTVPRQVLLDGEYCLPDEITEETCDVSDVPVEAFYPRPLGGTGLLEGSIEYRVPVGTTTLALFLDGALVGLGTGGWFQDTSGALTPGIGARFPSPAGPIRIDIGFRPSGAQSLPVVTESAAPEGETRRELVRLEERRRFDPLEDSGGLGRFLGRLVLHFSIGEAF